MQGVAEGFSVGKGTGVGVAVGLGVGVGMRVGVGAAVGGGEGTGIDAVGGVSVCSALAMAACTVASRSGVGSGAAGSMRRLTRRRRHIQRHPNQHALLPPDQCSVHPIRHQQSAGDTIRWLTWLQAEALVTDDRWCPAMQSSQHFIEPTPHVTQLGWWRLRQSSCKRDQLATFSTVDSMAIPSTNLAPR